jgi:putative ribosome biogenesis GTPase RsgA
VSSRNFRAAHQIPCRGDAATTPFERPGKAIERLRSLFLAIASHALTAHMGEGMASLVRYLSRGRVAALVASSNLGESTLCESAARSRTHPEGSIREDGDRGRRDTTHRDMYHLPRGRLLIDEPGRREGEAP